MGRVGCGFVNTTLKSIEKSNYQIGIIPTTFFFSKAHPNGTSIQCLFYGFLNLKIKLHNSNYKFIKLA